jgi:HSP20 family protein
MCSKEDSMATLVRWEPFRELASLQNDMSRLMNGLLEGNGRTSQSWVPAVDVWETEDELVYAFDLPGISQDEVSVEYESGALTVTGRRERSQEVSDERFYRFERRFGTFSRTIALPQGVSEDGISADHTDGVLEVHVRKPEQPKPRRIQVGGGEATTSEGSASQN